MNFVNFDCFWVKFEKNPKALTLFYHRQILVSFIESLFLVELCKVIRPFHFIWLDYIWAKFEKNPKALTIVLFYWVYTLSYGTVWVAIQALPSIINYTWLTPETLNAYTLHSSWKERQIFKIQLSPVRLSTSEFGCAWCLPPPQSYRSLRFPSENVVFLTWIFRSLLNAGILNLVFMNPRKSR